MEKVIYNTTTKTVVAVVNPPNEAYATPHSVYDGSLEDFLTENPEYTVPDELELNN